MIYIVAVAAVLVILCGVTAYKAGFVRTQTDFMVAGRSLAWPVLVFTLLSSWIGAGSLLAGAENAYNHGFVALWQGAGGWAGLIVIAFVAGRARKYAQYTVPDLLEARFNSVARVLATIAIVISCTVITSYQFIGGGDILHLIFPQISALHGLYIIAGFVIFFTAAAGMASIAYLDLIIGSLVTVTMVFAVPVLLHKAGGWAPVRAALPASHFEVLGDYSFSGALGLALPTMLLLVGNQGMYQKFFSARTERDAKLSVLGWIVGTVLLETLLVAFAVIASAHLQTERPREIIALTAKTSLPSILGAILLGGVFAKVISTANNYLFSPSTNLIHDVYQRFIRTNASQRETMIISRAIVVLLGLFAVLQATAFTSVLKAALYAYTVYGTAITPVVLAVFYWPRATPAGAVASILLGTAVPIYWEHAGYSIPSVYPALAASVLALVAVSLVTKPKSQVEALTIAEG